VSTKHEGRAPNNISNLPDCSEDMLELKRQIAIFTEHKTEAGSISYYAPGSEHDDGVMDCSLTAKRQRNTSRLETGEST